MITYISYFWEFQVVSGDVSQPAQVSMAESSYAKAVPSAGAVVDAMEDDAAPQFADHRHPPQYSSW